MLGTLRFSILVAVLLAAWAGYQMQIEVQEARRFAEEARSAYRCAASQTDQLLAVFKNDYDYVDLRRFGCAHRTLFVSIDDIQRVRSGGYESARSRPIVREPDLNPLVAATCLGFVSTMIVGLTLLRVRNVVRRLVRGVKRASGDLHG